MAAVFEDLKRRVEIGEEFAEPPVLNLTFMQRRTGEAVRLVGGKTRAKREVPKKLDRSLAAITAGFEERMKISLAEGEARTTRAEYKMFAKKNEEAARLARRQMDEKSSSSSEEEDPDEFGNGPLSSSSSGSSSSSSSLNDTESVKAMRKRRRKRRERKRKERERREKKRLEEESMVPKQTGYYDHSSTMDVLTSIMRRQKAIDKAFESVKKRDTGHAVEERPQKKCLLPSHFVEDILKKAKGTEELQILYKKATEEHLLNLSHKLELCRLEATHAAETMRSSLSNRESNEREFSSLENYANTLRIKHTKLENRLRTNQRKIAAFEQFEPLYLALEAKWGFTSPLDLINRLRTLDSSDTRLDDQVNRAIEETAEREREKRERQDEHEKRVATETIRMQKYLDNADSLRTSVEVTLASLNTEIESFKPEIDAYLTLYFAVLDVWNYWETESPLVDTNEPLEIPNKLDPILVTIAISNIATMHTPKTAHEALHKIQVICNQLWLKYFSDRDDLKGNPSAIVSMICDMLDNVTENVAKVDKVAQEWEKRNSDLYEEIKRETAMLDEALEATRYWQSKYQFSKKKRAQRAEAKHNQ